jgi:hypothetical protein
VPATPPPGRIVFRSGEHRETLQVYEGGRLREWPLPTTALSVRLSADGARVAAVLGDAAPQSVWTLSIADGSTAVRSLSLPPLKPQEYDLAFSPDLSWILYIPSLATAESELFLVNAISGAATRAVIPGGWLFDVDWRANNELVFVTGPMPENNAIPRSRPGRFFRWRGGSDPSELGQADFAGGLSLAPDGQITYTAMLPTGGPLIRTLGVSDPLLASDAIFATREGCALQYRSDLRMRPPEWSADGAVMAVVGNGDNLAAGFVAMRARGGGPVGVFRAPTYSCYIQQSAWSGSRYIVMLTGPNCGQTTLDGRLVVLDKQAHVEAEYVVDRKAFFVPSADGRWVASATKGGWQFIHLDAPNERIVVPLGALDGWCCP